MNDIILSKKVSIKPVFLSWSLILGINIINIITFATISALAIWVLPLR